MGPAQVHLPPLTGSFPLFVLFLRPLLPLSLCRSFRLERPVSPIHHSLPLSPRPLTKTPKTNQVNPVVSSHPQKPTNKQPALAKRTALPDQLLRLCTPHVPLLSLCVLVLFAFFVLLFLRICAGPLFFYLSILFRRQSSRQTLHLSIVHASTSCCLSQLPFTTRADSHVGKGPYSRPLRS